MQTRQLNIEILQKRYKQCRLKVNNIKQKENESIIFRLEITSNLMNQITSKRQNSQVKHNRTIFICQIDLIHSAQSNNKKSPSVILSKNQNCFHQVGKTSQTSNNPTNVQQKLNSLISMFCNKQILLFKNNWFSIVFHDNQQNLQNKQMSQHQIKQNVSSSVIFVPEYSYIINNVQWHEIKNNKKGNIDQNYYEPISEIYNKTESYFQDELSNQKSLQTILFLEISKQKDIHSLFQENFFKKVKNKLQESRLTIPKYQTRLKQLKNKKILIHKFKTINCQHKQQKKYQKQQYQTGAITRDSTIEKSMNDSNQSQYKQKQNLIKIVNIIKEQPIKSSFFQEHNQLNKYFLLEQRKCTIQNLKQHQPIQKILVVKRCKNQEEQRNSFIRLKSNQKLLRQVQIIQKLSHKNFLQYYKKLNQIDQKGFYMENIQYCLKIYVQNQELLKLNLTQKLEICLQLIQGVLYLHSKNIVHRDIKPENILFSFAATQKIQVKIIDFSDSVQALEGKSYCDLFQNLGCTLPYSHIECLGQKGYKDKRVDFWSVGAVIYWLIFGYAPVSIHQPHKLFCYQKWKDLFCHQINLRYHQGKLTQYLIKFVCLRLMKINLSLLHEDDLQISKLLLQNIIKLQKGQNLLIQSKQQSKQQHQSIIIKQEDWGSCYRPQNKQISSIKSQNNQDSNILETYEGNN